MVYNLISYWESCVRGTSRHIVYFSYKKRKRVFRLPRSGCLGTPLTLPQSLYGRTDGRTDGWTYADVRTKIFRINGLPNLLTHGAPRAPLLIRLSLNKREQKEHDEYVVLNNAALECLADVKVRIKDQEIERVELLSQRSLRSKKSSPSVRSSSTSSSKHAAIETAKLKAKLDTLKRRQEIDRRRDELKLQEKELKPLNEQEELHGELSAAEAIQKILQESELNDTITLQEAKTSADSTEKQRLSRISDSNFLAEPQAGTSVPDEIKRQDAEVNTLLLSLQRHLRHAMRAKKNREHKNIAQLSLAT